MRCGVFLVGARIARASSEIRRQARPGPRKIRQEGKEGVIFYLPVDKTTVSGKMASQLGG